MSLNTMQKIAVGFLGVILLGAVLLWLPVSNQEPIAFADALFTAVSAVCVTGLVTITPAVPVSYTHLDVYKRQSSCTSGN